jgi:hypothetical protein
LRHLSNYKQFENTKFFNPSQETMDKLEGYIKQKMSTNPDLNLSSWIYNNLIRKSGSGESPELKKWISENSTKFQSIGDGYLKTYGVSNPLIMAAQDDQGEWIGFNFNRKLKKKEVVSSGELTYNYYLTFDRDISNFKLWINSLNKLISKFYKACESGELKESAVSLKFGYSLNHYLEDNDHMKFYWYNKEDESKVEKIVNEWLSENKISTTQRPYSKGVDTGKTSSWGTKVSDIVTTEFEKLLKSNGSKFTPKQYASWIVDMLNTTKFKI